ncbi:type II secretion system protein GspE [Candidatus Marinamargulisbacteria bacterium SCGC AG-343-D04]|nr:type II secretion system protein GspE [Candidatus Marinamargulisbacteria bacterium SCGC AG-343-D04]
MILSLKQLLIENSFIKKEDFKLISNTKKNKEIFQQLLENDQYHDEDILKAIASNLKIPFDEVNEATFDPKVISLIPENYARENIIVPLFKLGETLFVAFDNPCSLNVIEELEIITKQVVSPVLSPKSSINILINYGYSYQEQKIEGDSSTMSSLFEMGLQLVGDEGGEEETTDLAHEAPIAKLVDTIITQAINEKASDIHIEPEENTVKIRFRVDGLLKDIMEPPKKLASPVISRLKILSELDITETRKPQDGRLTFSLKDRDVDFRVSTVRTITGEKMVLRILDKSDAFVQMDKLGFRESEFNKLDSLIYSTSGIVVVCGPTGSGKTSTLYAALSKINTPEKNIITIEDPVEFNLDGINQIPVNPKIGVDFVTGLSAIVRQDPDVIMIGEIRDIETASIAIQAALTGHLVFSTLHTRSAAGSVTRLINMGVQPFLINSSFLGVVGQRLVRNICPNCKKEVKYEEYQGIKAKTLLKKLTEEYNAPKIFKGAGCKYCNDLGYKGRIGIFEILTLDEDTRSLIIEKASSEKIVNAAIKNGMTLMVDDGIEKLMEGLTTVEELIRVIDV